jgi:acylphosphatase
MKRAARFIVQGTVQGIFFRQFVKEHAEKLGIVGFVRNLTNGDVEILAEGEIEKIGRLSKLVKKGPEHSQIRHVQIEERKFSDEFKDFRILRF